MANKGLVRDSEPKNVMIPVMTVTACGVIPEGKLDIKPVLQTHQTFFLHPAHYKSKIFSDFPPCHVSFQGGYFLCFSLSAVSNNSRQAQGKVRRIFFDSIPC